MTYKIFDVETGQYSDSMTVDQLVVHVVLNDGYRLRLAETLALWRESARLAELNGKLPRRVGRPAGFTKDEQTEAARVRARRAVAYAEAVQEFAGVLLEEFGDKEFKSIDVHNYIKAVSQDDSLEKLVCQVGRMGVYSLIAVGRAVAACTKVDFGDKELEWAPGYANRSVGRFVKK